MPRIRDWIMVVVLLGLVVVGGAMLRVRKARRALTDAGVTEGRRPPVAGSTTTVGSAGGAAPSPASTGVRRLTVDERRRLGEQIAAARRRASAARAAAGADRGGDDGADVTLTLEQVAGPAQEALQAAIPILADCVPAGADRRATARMVMISDPAYGTVIDTAAVTDADGRPLAPAVDTCLRDAIDALALPPLGDGGRLPLDYTFRFD